MIDIDIHRETTVAEISQKQARSDRGKEKAMDDKEGEKYAKRKKIRR